MLFAVLQKPSTLYFQGTFLIETEEGSRTEDELTYLKRLRWPPSLRKISMQASC